MPRWVRVAAVADCPPETGIEVVAEDQVLALFHVNDQFYAVDGICAHQGGPLGKGSLCGTTVTCPWHGWQYDVTTGRHRLSRITQRTFPVRVVDGEIQVGLGDED